jgi:hypothetical protein
MVWSIFCVVALIITLRIKSKTIMAAATPFDTSSAVLVIKAVYKKTRLRRQSPIMLAAVPSTSWASTNMANGK